MHRLTTFWKRGWLAKITLLLAGGLLSCCVFVVIIAQFAPDRPAQQALAQIPTAAATATPANTPTATATPKPTSTPKPTNTPRPTNTPAPTATATPLPEPVTLSGRGKVVTDPIVPPGALNRVIFTHTGRRNFIVHTFRDNGDEDYLANTIGSYEGQALLLGGSSLYFEVNADGAWTITIEPITNSGLASRFEGNGDAVVGGFDPPAERPIPYHFTHTGRRNFIVHLYCAGGGDSVVNEIGPVDGEAVVRFGRGPCVWEIKADGAWTLAPK